MSSAGNVTQSDKHEVSYIYGTYMFASTCFFCLATLLPSGSLTEPEHDKNYNKTCVIGKDSDQHMLFGLENY